MTLKELFDRCDFRDIAPILVKNDPDTKGYLHKLNYSMD